MTNKEKIILFYYEEKLNIIAISDKLKISKQYVSKIIKTDIRYENEKIRRKEESKLKQKSRNIENIKKTRNKNRIINDRINAILEVQHRQAAGELSGRKTINNRAFRNWNSSIYEFHSKTKEYRIKENLKNKISYAVPKKIKWDL